MQNASINLWSAMNSLADKELPNSDRACEVVQLASKVPSFGTELSLTVDEYGNWEVEIFSHEESNQRVVLRVDRHGNVVVKRERESFGISEIRQVSF